MGQERETKISSLGNNCFLYTMGAIWTFGAFPKGKEEGRTVVVTKTSGWLWKGISSGLRLGTVQ